MDFNTFKALVASEAASKGINDYELYYQTAENTYVSIYREEINEFTSAVAGGVCFRCMVDGKMGYASTEELSESAAFSLVSRAADNAAALETSEREFLGKGGQEYKTVEPASTELPETDKVISAALDAQRAVYAADSAVIDGTITEVSAQKMSIAIMNSNGLDLSYENALTAMIQVAIVFENDEVVDGLALKVGTLDSIDIDKLAAESAANARAQLGADVAPTGVYPVVFAPDAMASLLQTYSPVFSSEQAQKGLSLLAGKEGSTVAAECVTLADDPFYPDSPMPMPFDAEGTPTYRKNIIERGTLNTLLYDLKTASAAGRETTGNAAKGSYASKVSVSPFTMYIAPGEYTEEELLAKAGNGVYIKSLEGLHAGANVVSGDFSLQSVGFMIENGKKTTPVKSFTVAGNFFDLLRQITAVSDKVVLPMATDITSFGSPNVLVEGLSIAGK
jgi:PmbA protein